MRAMIKLLRDGANQGVALDLSVIIPVYNAEDYLEQCLKSIPHSDIDLEILCFNDGSTDDSLAVMRTVAQNDYRIKIIDKVNEGYGATVNRGIARAEGRYIAILEPDDYLDGDMYTVLFRLAQKFDYPDIVKSAYWSVGDSTTRKKNCRYRGRIRSSGRFCIQDEPLLLRYHPSIWSAIYRKAFLVDKGINFKQVAGAGWVDNPFLVDTMLRAESIVYTDEAFYCYREQRIGSSTTTMRDMCTPFDRWHEMADTLEGLQIEDETILDIHAYRAFYNLKVARRAQNYTEESWLEGAKRVAERLDPSVVARSSRIAPKEKKLYEQLTGRQLGGLRIAAYCRNLTTEGYWRLFGRFGR